MSILSDEQLIQVLLERLSDRKKALEEQNYLLAQLKSLNEKLKESESIKSNFLSNIRNEINNPFTSILGLSNYIRQGSVSDPEKVKNMAALIYSEAFYLNFQLKNIFAAAEIEAGEAFPESVEMNIMESFFTILDSLRVIAEKKNISFNIQYDEAVKMFNTDPAKLYIIISNIVSNAIEFSPNNSVIDINISVGDSLIVQVIDKGPGFPASLANEGFKRFRQYSEGMTKNHKGHGLGLSVVQALLEIVNGSIEIEDTSEGSKVVILIHPLSQPVKKYSGDGSDLLFDSYDEKF